MYGIVQKVARTESQKRSLDVMTKQAATADGTAKEGAPNDAATLDAAKLMMTDTSVMNAVPGASRNVGDLERCGRNSPFFFRREGGINQSNGPISFAGGMAGDGSGMAGCTSNVAPKSLDGSGSDMSGRDPNAESEHGCDEGSAQSASSRLFAFFDHDGSGTIEEAEMVGTLQSLGFDLRGVRQVRVFDPKEWTKASDPRSRP